MVEENSIHTLNERIQNSSLSQEDKLIWADGIQKIDEKTANDILDYVEEFPENIQWATDILKRKIDVLKNNDTEAWNQILEEERMKLEPSFHEEPSFSLHSKLEELTTNEQ